MNLIKLVAAAVLAMTTTAAAETWECRYTGHWTTEDSGNAGDFTWLLTWRTAGAGWELTGNYTDRYGKSTLDGHCQQSECKMRQHSVSGSLDGKTYFWRGTYTDSADGNDRTINKFTGTWGDSPDHRSNGGRVYRGLRKER